MTGYYLRLTWYGCYRQPTASALIVFTLAIGIAACMTTLTVFAVFAGSPIPGVSAYRYVVTMEPAKDTQPSSQLSLYDAKALVDAHKAAAQATMAAAQVRITRTDGNNGETVRGVLAYGQILPVLGVRLRSGRAWTQRELRSHAPVVMLDTEVARHLFGSADVVGQSVRIGHELFRIIGVTAPWQPRMRFSRVEQAGTGPIGRHIRIFLPIGAALSAGVGPVSSGHCGNSAANATFGTVNTKRCLWLENWVALPTPAAVSAYNHFLEHYASEQHVSSQFAKQLRTRLYGMRAWMEQAGIGPDGVALNTWLAGAFLVLCMTNVIGLITARFVQAEPNIAIRRALGATRRNVVWQHLVEAAALGLAGGLVALPLTLLGLWIVRQQPVGYAPAAQFSLWVFVGLIALSLGVGALVGAWPAWHVCRRPPALRIREA